MSDPVPAPKLPPDATPLEIFFKGNRALAAAALIVLLEAVPAAGMVSSLREGGGVWTVFSAVLMFGAALPPVGVFLGQRWGYILGQYVVWASLAGVFLRVLHTGFTMLFLLPAMLLGVLLVSLSPPRTPGETRRTEKKPESFGVWLKENMISLSDLPNKRPAGLPPGLPSRARAVQNSRFRPSTPARRRSVSNAAARTSCRKNRSRRRAPPSPPGRRKPPKRNDGRTAESFPEPSGKSDRGTARRGRCLLF